jgi:hypothetical protein
MKNVALNKKRWAVGLFLMLISLLTSFTANSFALKDSLAGTDSSVFIYVAHTILKGGMPYLDTFDHKGPLLYLINALGILINERYGLWFIELLFIFGTFVFSYKIARLSNCNQTTACVVVTLNVLILLYYFEGGNLVEEYACFFITLSLYCFLDFLKTSNTKIWKLILCGASFAAVCLLRINMIALWGVMCIGVLIYCIKKGIAKKIVFFAFWFMVGFAMVCTPILLWLWKNSAFIPFIKDYFLFNFSYSTVSISEQIRSIIHFCSGNPIIISIPILFYFCFANNTLSDWFCLFTLVSSILSIGISGRQYPHYGMILCPLIIYAISNLFNLILQKNTLPNKQRSALFVSIFFAIILLFFNQIKLIASSLYHIPFPINNLNPNIQIAEIIQNNTTENDKITICGNSNIIYLLSDRDSVSKYSYQTPIAEIDPKIKEEYLSDIRNLTPKIIVIEEDCIIYDDVINIIKNKYSLLEIIDKKEIYRITK